VTVTDSELLAEYFESHRDRLRGLALRLLGSGEDADEVVQEAWLRLGRADAGAVENLGGWLTTVVGRICIDVLRTRDAKPESPMGEPPEQVTRHSPEDEAVLADSVGVALLVVLDTLAPAERLAFVLHDMFAVPFEEIAPIVDRTPTAARKLASRARRRVQSDAAVPDAYPTGRQEVVAAFLAAARDGDFAALLRLLDPEVVLRADAHAVAMAGERIDVGGPELSAEMHGVDAVMRVFAGRAKAARLATVDGLPGAVWAPGGKAAAAFSFVVRDDKVVSIELLTDPETLAGLELEL
jgi:RNA polymerase sigma factor (sigma-70 family)